MTRKQILSDIQTILTHRRDALRQAISGDDSLLKNFHLQSGGDVVDFASESAFGELSSQLAEVESREFQLVELALEKMEEGSYGKCSACQHPIPIARLQALPYATCCVNCQRAAEKAGVEPSAVADWTNILDTGSPSNDRDLHLS